MNFASNRPPTLDWLRGVQALFDRMPDVYFFAKNRAGRFIAVNQAFLQKRVGHSRKRAFLGTTDFDFWPRDIAEKYIKDDLQVMSSGKSLENVVEPAILPDRSMEWHLVTKIPLYDLQNRIAGIAGYGRDLNNENQGLLLHMGKVFDHVVRNYQSNINIAELAALLSLSISQFERQFKKLFAITPIQYLSRVRVDMACQALVGKTGSISQVARQTGFYDSSHFTRNFRKIMGLTPREYRLRYLHASDFPRVPNLTHRSFNGRA
jgi:AraC-like DNA-binding protein